MQIDTIIGPSINSHYTDKDGNTFAYCHDCDKMILLIVFEIPAGNLPEPETEQVIIIGKARLACGHISQAQLTLRQST